MSHATDIAISAHSDRTGHGAFAGAQPLPVVPLRPWALVHEYPGLTPAHAAVVIHDHVTERTLALTETQAAVVRALQLLSAEADTELLRRACERKYGVVLALEEVHEILSRLDELGLLERYRTTIETREHQRRAVQAIEQERQLELLRRTVRRLRSEIPHYERTLSEVPPEILDELSRPEQVRALPVITKEEVRQYLPWLVPEDQDRYIMEWKSTSGSTSERLQMPHAGYFSGRSTFYVFRLNRTFFGRAAGQPWCQLATPHCSGTECHMEMELPYEARHLGPEMYGPRGLVLNSGVNPTRFSEAKLQAMVEDIRRHGARYLNCDAWYTLGLALYVRKHRPEMPRLEGVALSYEVSSKVHKRIIEDAFECRAYEMYGSNECGEMGFECEHGQIHVPFEAVMLELLDVQGQPVGPGQVGRVYVTTFNKHTAPLLRYQTTDLVRTAAAPCRCGLAEPSFETVLGRISDAITAADGRVLLPRDVDDVIAEVPPGIGWYQLIQTDEKAYRFYAVPIEGYTDSVLEAARAALHDLLGAGIRLSVEATQELRPSSSGKFRICYQDRSKKFPGLVSEDMF